MAQHSLFVLYACLLATTTVNALSSPIRAKVARVVHREEVSSRRSLLKNLLAASVATSTAAMTVAGVSVVPALAAEDDKDIDVYFGCGCFWHVMVSRSRKDLAEYWATNLNFKLLGGRKKHLSKVAALRRPVLTALSICSLCCRHSCEPLCLIVIIRRFQTLSLSSSCPLFFSMNW
jgi:hypothetical protein